MQIITSLAETTAANDRQEQTVNSEAHKPELNTLNALKELFDMDSTEMPETVKNALEHAPGEITGIIVSPVKRMETTIATLPEHIDPKVKADFEKQHLAGLQALEFFNGFCENANQIDEYTMRVETDPNGGIDIFMRPKNRTKAWGSIGKESVSEIEVRIRNGTNQETASEAYTPMQLNFRFLKREGTSMTEVTSLRIDMHNREDSEIQVDAIVGGDKMDKKHERVRSMNEGDRVQNFRALQAAFLVNFSEKFLIERTSEGKILANPALVLSPEYRQDATLLLKEVASAKAYLKDLRESE